MDDAGGIDPFALQSLKKPLHIRKAARVQGKVPQSVSGERPPRFNQRDAVSLSFEKRPRLGAESLRVSKNDPVRGQTRAVVGRGKRLGLPLHLMEPLLPRCPWGILNLDG